MTLLNCSTKQVPDRRLTLASTSTRKAEKLKLTERISDLQTFVCTTLAQSQMRLEKNGLALLDTLQNNASRLMIPNEAMKSTFQAENRLKLG